MHVVIASQIACLRLANFSNDWLVMALGIQHWSNIVQCPQKHSY